MSASLRSLIDLQKDDDRGQWTYSERIFADLLEVKNIPFERIKEDKNNSYYKTTWWIFVEYEYKEAFKRSYEKASKEDREKVKSLPNFDADIFYEISWIRVDEKMEKEIKIDWKTIKISEESFNEFKKQFNNNK